MLADATDTLTPPIVPAALVELMRVQSVHVTTAADALPATAQSAANKTPRAI